MRLRCQIVSLGLCAIFSAAAGCGPENVTQEDDTIAEVASPIVTESCGSRTDYFKVVSSTGGTHCYAYAGNAYVSYGGNVTVTSGNNAGMVWYYQHAVLCNPGQCLPLSRPFDKWSTFSFSFGPGGGITRIFIK